MLKSIASKFKAKFEDYMITIIEIVASAAIGLLVGAIILHAFGYDIAKCYSIVFTKGIRDLNYLLCRASPIMMTGLAFTIPMIAGVFNIGGEGQLYIGALTSILIAHYTHNLVLAFIASAVMGAAIGALIAFLRVYRGVNEVITAIMLNWTFYYIVLYLITNVYYDPAIPHQSVPVPEDARIGFITMPWGSIRATFFIAVVFSLIAYYILKYTKVGYLLRVSGLSPKSAKYAGFNPDKAIIYSMMLGGAYAGIGGALLTLGLVPYIDSTMSIVFGQGFTGIGVALLGRNNPIGIIFSSIFFSILIIGGQMMELLTGAPPELADVLTGVIVISLALPYAYRMMISYIKTRRMIT